MLCAYIHVIKYATLYPTQQHSSFLSYQLSFLNSIQMSEIAGLRKGTPLPNKTRGREEGVRSVNKSNIMFPASSNELMKSSTNTCVNIEPLILL